MNKLAVALVILCLPGTPASAGPNAGGTLVVHDTGLVFSSPSDLPSPPSTVPPWSCPDGFDVSLPPGGPDLQSVWKVYAVFPDGSSPRLRGLAWAIAGTGSIYVTAAGTPDPQQCWEVPEGSWPSPPGAIGQGFSTTRTEHVIECYWFGGYGYQGSVFATASHPHVGTDFCDDAYILDAIAGLSSIGFGVPGELVCPGPVEAGACCHPDGSCEFVPQDNCSGTWFGGDCAPGLCSPSPLDEKTWGGIKATYR